MEKKWVLLDPGDESFFVLCESEVEALEAGSQELHRLSEESEELLEGLLVAELDFTVKLTPLS